MAEFGSTATSLSEPKGAGAEVVAPVTVNDSPIASLGALGGMLVNATKEYTKQKAQDAQTEVLTAYSKKLETLRSAYEADPRKMSASRLTAEVGAVTGQYLASHAGLTTELVKIRNAFSGGTQIGDAEQQIKDERTLQKQRESNALSEGLSIIPGMTKEEVENQVRAGERAVYNRKVLQDFITRQEFAMKTDKYNKDVATAEYKDNVGRLVSETAGVEIPAFHSTIESLSRAVKSGSQTYEQALFTLNKNYSRVVSNLDAVAVSHPEMASSFRSLFAEINTMGEKLINPKTSADVTRSQVDSLMARAELVALTSSPQIMSAALINKFLTQSPESFKVVSGAAKSILTVMTSGTDSTQLAPQVLGDVKLSNEVVKVLKDNINKPVDPADPEKDVKAEQGARGVSSLLTQIKTLSAHGKLTSQNLAPVASLVASPAFGKMVQEKKIDADTLETARQAFHGTYNQDAIQSIGEVLQSPVSDVRSTIKTNKTVLDVLDIVDSSTGIQFRLSNSRGGSSETIAAHQRKVEEASKVLNRVIQIGAHLEGRTDYNEFWKEKRSVLMPQLYAIPGLREGDIKEGANNIKYQYIGGPDVRKDSWKPVK